MQKSSFFLFLSVFAFITPPLIAQSFMYTGVIIDSNTNKLLQNVKIFRMSEQDTSQIMNSISGTFQVMISKGTKLHFRKAGYAWHSIKISDDTMIEETVYLLPSKSVQLDTGNKEYSTEIIYDNEIVPQNEWNDVLSISPNEIGSIKAYIKDEKNILDITSKP